MHPASGSCTFSLRIMQLPENQVASLRFANLRGGTRDGTRPAVPHALAAWHPGALCKPALGLATAPRSDQPRHHTGHEVFTCAQAVSWAPSISRPALPVRTGHRSMPRLPLLPHRRWSPDGDAHARWTHSTSSAPVHTVPIRGNRRDGAMRCNNDCNLLKTWIFESAPQQLISYEAGHASGVKIVKNQYVRNAVFACCVLSHVPSRWPYRAQ
jgi:hypothetical protein